MKPDKTSDLMELLKQSSVHEIGSYLRAHHDPLMDSHRPFTDYMRSLIRSKGLKQQVVFLRAGIPERYGYKLLSMERNTIQRDYILRLCMAAGLTLSQTQRALRLYGMAELYPKVPRDAVLIVAINTGITDPDQADELLLAHGQTPLRACNSEP